MKGVGEASETRYRVLTRPPAGRVGPCVFSPHLSSPRAPSPRGMVWCRVTAGILFAACLAGAATPKKANVVTFLIDDMDLERIPFYPKLDPGAAWQLQVHKSSGGCLHGGANCTYSAPNIEGVGAKGAKVLGGHVPVSVCTPSRSRC